MSAEPESFVKHVDEDMVNKNDRDTNQFWMKRREFGSFNEAAYRVNRLRRLVVIFGGIVIVMALCLAYVVSQWMSDEPKEAVLASAVSEAEASVPPTVDILISNRHIPKGEELTAEMFKTAAVQLENVPEGSVGADHLEAIVGKYADQTVTARSPLLYHQLTDLPPEARQRTPFHIPAGHRAIAINVDRRTSVEGFAKPGTFVDVFWFYTDKDGSEKLARIVPRAKILSVGGQTEETAENTEAESSTTVTLLVSLPDAKLLELARNLGKLSLTLVSEEDAVEQKLRSDDAITVRDIFRRLGNKDRRDEPFDGYLKTYDPRLGRWVNYKLSSGSWKVEVGRGSKALRGSSRAQLSNEPADNSDWMKRYIIRD